MEQSPDDDSCNGKGSLLHDLNIRLEKYLSVLQVAEGEGNSSKVRRYTRIVKQYKDAIALHQKGKPVPLDELPNPPGFEPLVKTSLLSPSDEGSGSTPQVSPVPSRRLQPSPSPAKRLQPSPTADRKNLPSSSQIGKISPSTIGPRKMNPETVLKSSDDLNLNSDSSVQILINDKASNEVKIETDLLFELTSRLKVYQDVLKMAEGEGNSSKARRYNRIIKQYNDAISLQKSGKVVPLDELPNPPNFPPLVPVKSNPPSPIPPRKDITPSNVEFGTEITENEPLVDLSGTQGQLVVTRADKQTVILKERQKEYRDAALAAKKAGEINEAKEFLKLCKGFDRLIQASESGLPVDLTTIPVSLKSKKEVDDSFHVVTEQDFSEAPDLDIYDNLEKELLEQIKMCMTTRNHFKTNGDIANANRFEQHALQFKKDLNYIKASRSNNLSVPKFHYENKSFSTIRTNSDLTDNELELTIIQGINYKVSNPNDVDTYVTYEFPYPQDNPPSGRTSLVKNTNNPVYNTRLVFPIHRETRLCQRIFKRHGIKLEVWSKGGFFHSDTSLGNVVVKLMPLNTEITIHDAFDLMNGRRPAGGKLEVKIRIREPIFAKKVDTVNEKWLIIDYK